MPINRELRREYADQLASFMRGEMDTETMFQVIMSTLARNKNEEDHAVDRLHSLWFHKRVGPHAVSVSRQTWEHMRRTLAMLESNLDIEFWPTGHRATLGIRGGWAVGCVLLALAYTAYLLFGLSLTMFCTLWISSGILGIVVEQFFGIREPKRPFQPFDSEAQWLKYEPLLARFNLPEYDPAVHHKRVPSRLSWWKWFVVGITTMGTLILLAILSLILCPFQIVTLFKPEPRIVRRIIERDSEPCSTD